MAEENLRQHLSSNYVLLIQSRNHPVRKPFHQLIQKTEKPISESASGIGLVMGPYRISRLYDVVEPVSGKAQD